MNVSDSCATRVSLTDQYLMLQCETDLSLTLFQLGGDNYLMTQVLYMDEITSE